MTAAVQFQDIALLLAPKSVAVIGASDRPGNLGGDTVRRLVKFGFRGPVWPVNPSSTEVAGLACYPSIAALPGVPDAVVLALPATALIEAVRDCAARGVRNGVAYAGGLADAGGEGIAIQNALVALCRETGFKLCGPNCVGIINTDAPATLTFATALHEIDKLNPGVISMVSQSGGIGTTAFAMAQLAGFGFRHLVSSGNEAVVDFCDYLYAFARDPGTRILVGYLEGLTDGPKFIAALAEARAQGKPVVLIKAGATPASARAAKAHTGALVGEDRVFDAVLREFGAIRVFSIEEMIDVALMLIANLGKTPPGRNLGIVTFGGGNGVLAADQCAQNGIAVPDLSRDGFQRLRPLLVSVATAANPVDLTPSTAFRPESLALLPQALDVIAAEPHLHSLLFIAGSLASRAAEISTVVEDFARRSSKPTLVSWPSPPIGVPERLAARGIYNFAEPARAIRALGRWAANAEPRADIAVAPSSFDWPSHVPARTAPFVISEHQCHRLLKAAGLPVAAGELAADEAAAGRAAAAIGFPVALKGISEKITHRAAAGLVALDLRSAEQVTEQASRFFARAREMGVTLDGVYVQKMHKGGAELLLAAIRDPLFGVMISCGSGGGMTELIDDVITERAPVGAALAAQMLARLRLARIAPKGNAAADFIARFSALAAAAPWQRFIFELNPVKWTAECAIAMDGLLVVEES